MSTSSGRCCYLGSLRGKRQVPENPKRVDNLAAALMAVKDHPGYVAKAEGLGLDKIAVWWGLTKSSEMKTSIMKEFKGYPEVLKAMKK